ncbi:MAG: hypothetical protein ACLP8S_03375 [Solirubrobacteraceae bacterium]
MAEHAGFLLEQASGDQPRGGAVLRWAGESVAGALFGRAGERAVQHARGCEVKWLAVGSPAAGDFRVGDDPWSGRERVGVMSRPLDGLAGLGEVRLKAAQGIDGSLKRPSQPARELVCGARLVDAGK